MFQLTLDQVFATGTDSRKYNSNIIKYSNIPAGVQNLTLDQVNEATFTDHSSMEIQPPAAPDEKRQQDNGKFSIGTLQKCTSLCSQKYTVTDKICQKLRFWTKAMFWHCRVEIYFWVPLDKVQILLQTELNYPDNDLYLETIWILKCICLNCKIYLSKSQNVFCPNLGPTELCLTV